MMVVCLFPVTNNIDNAPLILNKFKTEIAPKLEILGATNIEIRFPGTNYVYVGTGKTLEGQPKGKGILESLKNCSIKPEYVLVCDGSGKIPYNYIIDIFRVLVSDSNIQCVMTNIVNANNNRKF